MRALLIGVWLVGCGGSGTTVSSADAPVSSADAPVSSADAPVSSADARSPDASAPTRVACAGTTCAATATPSMNLDSEHYCCATAYAGDSPSFCVAGNLGVCESGNPLYCDEAADCQPGLVCCNSTVRGGLFHCAASESCGGLQMCRTDAECANGKTCTTRMCAGASYGFCGALSPDQAAALLCP
jgi:hypothetical protein